MLEVITMNEIEKRLAAEKKRIDAIHAPEQIEQRLRHALRAAPSSKRRSKMWKFAAAALFLSLLIGTQYNAIAFYGKTLFGFGELTSDTLARLNEQGKGQAIEKGMTLLDGTELTIEGIMTDANQLILYYRLFNSKGVDEETSDLFNTRNITGFLTNAHVISGTSIMNDDRTEIKGILSFEPVSPFSKKLTLHFSQQVGSSQYSEEALTFPYYPNQAMPTMLKQSIRQTVEVDKGIISFHSITATPTMTVITGSLNVENFDRVSDLSGIQLVVDGVSIDQIGSSIESSFNGRKLELKYDALPEEIENLELIVEAFAGYETLEKKISLPLRDERAEMLSGKQLWIDPLTRTSQGIELTIATDEDVMLDQVSVVTTEGITPLETTLNQTYMEQDGQSLKVRTLWFETNEQPEELLIEGMHYMKRYGHVIEIPIQ
jgi:hypothetical protein